MIQRLRTIVLLINLKTIAIAAMAILSTSLCLRYNISANSPLALIATAIIFPIVFSINSAYKRREMALDDYGSLKAHGRAIYFATRDWLENTDECKQQRCRELKGGVLRSTREMSTAPRTETQDREKQVYGYFSDLSVFIRDDLQKAGLAAGEVSRCSQYLSKMVLAFEQIKHVYQYRTPRTLRAFSDIFITILPPLYGPYFAYIAQDYTPQLTYVMLALFAVILSSLDNIQAHLENPFDQIGQDDVTINAEKFMDRLKSNNCDPNSASAG